jgi:hypothetical protein
VPFGAVLLEHVKMKQTKEHLKSSLKTDIHKYLDKHGYKDIFQISTGGGCTAYHKELKNGFSLLLTDTDGYCPADYAADSLLCIYNSDGDQWTNILQSTAIECIQMMAAIESKEA